VTLGCKNLKILLSALCYYRNSQGASAVASSAPHPQALISNEYGKLAARPAAPYRNALHAV